MTENSASTSSNTPAPFRKKISIFAYIIGGLSLIFSWFPFVGWPFAIIAVIWGAFEWKNGGKPVLALGIIGIVLTVSIYGSLFHIASKQDGIFADSRNQLTQILLNDLPPLIEFYKLQHGTYPESLKVLQESWTQQQNHSPLSIKDAAHVREFYYERVGQNHYYLRGLGADGQPFTTDDIVPTVANTPDSKIGLLLQKQ